MTNDLLKLTDEVTSDTQDKRLERLIEAKSDEIRQALREGKGSTCWMKKVELPYQRRDCGNEVVQ